MKDPHQPFVSQNDSCLRADGWLMHVFWLMWAHIDSCHVDATNLSSASGPGGCGNMNKEQHLTGGDTWLDIFSSDQSALVACTLGGHFCGARWDVVPGRQQHRGPRGCDNLNVRALDTRNVLRLCSITASQGCKHDPIGSKSCRVVQHKTSEPEDSMQDRMKT